MNSGEVPSYDAESSDLRLFLF